MIFIMAFDAKEKSEWELRNEISKVNVRWSILFFTAVYLFFQIASDSREASDILHRFDFQFISGIAVLTVLMNLFYNLYLIKIRKSEILFHPALKYASMIFDLSVVTLLLVPTGGSGSMFFLLYIVVLLSNGMRYGMRLAVSGILIFNIFYVIFLFYLYFPDFETNGLRQEILKVTGIWVVGLYIGYLSRRFQILHGEVEKYKNLLKIHLETAGESRGDAL